MRSSERSSVLASMLTSEHSPTTPLRPAGAVRRGSALIIVIGTLALIAVFAAIYISIGRADTRAVATQESRATQGGYSDRYAEYVARIIAIDRLDATMQYADALQRYQVPRREATDAPYTDWSMRSESDDPANWFFPAGGNPYPRASGDNFDPRVPSDPWLASLRPQYLGELGLPDVTPFSTDGPTDALALEGYLDNRDWLQISNFAPDGRFVNLFNLRPQASPLGGTALGGFNAEPGWGFTSFPDGTSIRRMSEGLSLYRQRAPGDPESPIQSFDPTTDGFWLPGLDAPQSLVLTASDIQNIPAVWSMYQRFALIPLNQPFVTYNRDNGVSSWADPDFPAYQWGDADGDGFADSRWFELTESREGKMDGDEEPRTDVQRLYDAGQFRVFAAVRAVDLSGMVNVNTARDALTPPTAEYPIGLTPSEVDLRRLLTMQDQAETYDGDANPGLRVEPLSFAHIRAPALENGVAQNAALRPASDYSRYRQRLLSNTDDFTLDPGTPGLNQFPTSANPGQPEFGNAMSIGRYAASAIHESVVRNVTLPVSARGVLSLSSVAIPADLELTEGSPLLRPSGAATDFRDLGEQRKDYYDSVGKINPLRLDEAGVRSLAGRDATTEGQYFGMGLFGLDDLAELLTFHGLNDPEVTSRLESAAQGRLQFEGGSGDERYSPLLSTRPLSLDRDLHGQIAVNAANPNRGSRVTGEISRESMALMALSPRTKMTTVSGAVPFRPASVAGVAGATGASRNRAPIAPGSLSFTNDAAVSVSDLTNTQSAFNLYYRALAGELEVFRLKRASGVDGLPAGVINAAWDNDLSNVRNNPYSTLFYGHRGPELALRIAAHAAANAKDLFDNDDQPTVMTLLLDNSTITRTIVENVTENSNYGTDRFDLAASQEALLYPGLSVQPANAGGASPNLLDVDAGVTDRAREVLPRDRLPEPRRLVNVYGVEPTPIITEVASMFVYTDAAVSAGGLSDSGPSPRPNRPIPLPGSIQQITIDTSLSDGNSDLLMQVLAIQLTNPWDVPINLGGGTGPGGLMWRVNNDQNNLSQPFNAGSNLEFNYYIEFNGRFFKLGEYREFIPPITAASGTDYGASTRYRNSRGPVPLPGGQPLADIANPPTPELQYQSVVLGPGESRVFYVTAHTQLYSGDLVSGGVDSVDGLDKQWRAVVDAYGNIPPQFDLLVGTNGENYDVDNDGRPDGLDNRGWTGLAQDWLNVQLSVEQQVNGSLQRVRPARIHPFDPRTGELVEGATTLVRPTPFVNMFKDRGDPASDLGLTGRVADSSQVRLWRKYTSPTLEEVPAVPAPRGNATVRNLVQNDILVDRLYLSDPAAGPTQNYLAKQLSELGDREIPDTVSFAEDFEPVTNCPTPGSGILNVRNDNRGLTLIRWANARRKETMTQLNNQESQREPNVGKVDAYLISSRRDPLSTITRSESKIPDAPSALDLLDLCDPSDPVRWDSGSKGLLSDIEYDAFLTPVSFYQRAFNNASSLRNPVRTLAEHPRRKNLTGTRNLLEGDRFDVDELAALPGRLSLFERPGSTPVDDLRPEIFLTPRLDNARVTDALLAMGIGPVYAPDPTRDPTNNYEVVDSEWMTLSEAFAVALGFENFTTSVPPINTATDVTPDIVWYDAVRNYTDPAGNAQVEYVLDDLRLRIDDYVAFLNLQRGGELEKAFFTFNPASPNSSDARRGTGVPIALGVLDALRAVDPLRYPNDPADAGLRGLTSPVMGLVNINTAPLDVLRLLPGLSPSAVGYRTRNDENSGNFGVSKPEAWAAANGLATGDALGLDGPTPTTKFLTNTAFEPPLEALNNPDIAAGLAAYRDRTFTQPRGRSDPRFFQFASVPIQMSYALDPITPDADESFLDNRYGEQDNDTFRTRSAISGVNGLRGTPGFGSLGEMLMASIADDVPIPVVGASTGDIRQDLGFYRQLSMQQAANDTRNLGVVGTGDNAVSLSPNFLESGSLSVDANRAGSTPDDYVEKLAAAAGVMNMTTTRSDFYAVWMVLQGFQESDLANLREDDALVPSFKRRYLMVIDRSNVVEPGDAPQIVLMREVPL